MIKALMNCFLIFSDKTVGSHFKENGFPISPNETIVS